MGFFSSNRTEPSERSTEAKSVTHVIRSRFYGSRKGKARELDPQQEKAVPNPSPDEAAPALRQSVRARPPTDRNTLYTPASDPRPPKSGTRSSADALTMTLAQRLNELSVANSEGLLDDDEYRLLRQNLFERFSSGTAVPTEAPVIRLNAGQNHTRNTAHSRTATTSYAGSSRAPSIQSKTSVSSTVTSIFRRATGRRSASSPAFDQSDTTSVFSHASKSSSWNLSRKVFASSLYRNGSQVSLQAESSRGPFDSRSIASRRNGESSPITAFTPHPSQTSSASLSRSATRSNRRLGGGAPPSSFPGRSTMTEPRRSLGDVDGTFDDEHLDSAKDIRAEIEQVEAEGRRLLDAFNGLELSTLTKRHRRVPTLTSLTAGDPNDVGELNESLQSKWTIVPEGRSGFRSDNDGMSVHSGRSVGTTMSGPRSMKSGRAGRMLPTSGPAPHSAPITRKSSFSSVSSRGTNLASQSHSTVPPVPGLPNVHRKESVVHISKSNGQLRLAPVEEAGGHFLSVSDGASDVSRTWSDASGGDAHRRPRRAVSDEDAELRAMEKELGDIRRRRGEVTARYEARLEYLRAKLKAAEIREKLLRS